MPLALSAKRLLLGACMNRDATVFALCNSLPRGHDERTNFRFCGEVACTGGPGVSFSTVHND